MSTEVATTKAQTPATWKDTLANAMPSIAESLPRHITADKFRQVAATAIGSTPALKQCMQRNPAAVLTALASCAKDGLLPDNKQAALVPYKDNLTYIPMISGVLMRMRNSGEVESISAEVVYENDHFDVVLGDDPRIDHKPNWKTDRGGPVAAYAIIRMTSGEVYREVMSKQQIEDVKSASKAKGGPWSGPFVLEMWRKTVLKRAAKYCPLSDERIRTMLDRDNDLYDLDQPRQPTPMQSRFEKLRAEAPRPRYGQAEDEQPSRDINEDIEDAEFIEATPTPQTGLDDGEAEEPVTSHETGKLQDTLSPSEESSASPPPNAKEFYAESMAKLKGAHKTERKKVLDDIIFNPHWDDLSKSQQDTLQNAAEA